MPADETDNKVDSGDRKLGRETRPDDSCEARDDATPKEIGGRNGPDPTRYGDWEKAGRCIDF